MSMLTLNIWSNFESAAADMKQLGLDVRSFKEPLTRSVRQVMTKSLQQNFDSQGRPEAWQPLAQSTLLTRMYRGIEGDQILVATGALRRAVGLINIWTITKDTAEVTQLPQKVWYGALQDEGFETSRMSAPARPFMLIQDSDLDAIESIFDDWLGERFKAKGFV